MDARKFMANTVPCINAFPDLFLRYVRRRMHSFYSREYNHRGDPCSALNNVTPDAYNFFNTFLLFLY